MSTNRYANNDPNTTYTSKIRSNAFYQEYFGHQVRHLQPLYERLREQHDALIWTAGDSSLDNKYWFSDRRSAVPGVYADLLDPPQSKPDITYWLNELLYEHQQQQQDGQQQTVQHPDRQQQQQPSSDNVNTRTPNYAAINTAVEATTLNERTFCLRSQDVFIRDNIQSNDILIVSVGGNDVALQPCPCTIVSILSLIYCVPMSCIENGSCTCGTLPIDDCCCGCGPSLCSCACACPPCLGYFRHLFVTRASKYIAGLTSKTKPAKVLVCMIYYPNEHIPTYPGWADPALQILGYNRNPAKVQCLIRKFYQLLKDHMKIPNTEVIPIPFFHVLNGKIDEDYISRVEPSVIGGRKMAEFLLDAILRNNNNNQSPDIVSATVTAAATAPTTITTLMMMQR